MIETGPSVAHCDKVTDDIEPLELGPPLIRVPVVQRKETSEYDYCDYYFEESEDEYGQGNLGAYLADDAHSAEIPSQGLFARMASKFTRYFTRLGSSGSPRKSRRQDV